MENFDIAKNIDELIRVSRHYGKKSDFVLAGGGNTSFKTAKTLYVKGSGVALAEIDESGFVEMDRQLLEEILAADLGADAKKREELFKNAIMSARRHPELNQRPSVECVLHNLLKSQLVIHTHATLVNSISCGANGEQRCRELFGDEVIWVDYVDPGFTLAKTVFNKVSSYLKTSGRTYPPAIIMENHGLIVCGDSADEIKHTTSQLIAKIEGLYHGCDESKLLGTITIKEPSERQALISIIAPSLRGLLAESSTLKIVTYDDSEEAIRISCADQGKEIAAGGPLTPDQIVYCKSFPMWVEIPANAVEGQIIEILRQELQLFIEKYGYSPKVVLVKGLGLFAVGDDYTEADIVRQVYLDAVMVMIGAKAIGSIQYLKPTQREFIENWEAENYRKKVSKGANANGRVVGKIAIVTGAARGIGYEISAALCQEGAYIGMGDINQEGVGNAAAKLSEKNKKGRAVGITVDVTSKESIDEMVFQIVRRFGGVDILVSNAGVLFAESVKTQSEKDFDAVNSVNYKGYFLCVQAVCKLMAIQHQAREDYWSDIIQINSKSGLQGSVRNFAYAGSKFGGIGLTQSFAMELVEDGIKVNAVCPGNFLDGPLWSDPKNGLFVQYLKSGKVPGAKTVEDVRKAYEAKVPMGRGCETADVMKAIYYLIEQKYETGQAVPVTGGQVMLN